MKDKVLTFVGIDPGISGAIAVVSWRGKYLEVYDTPSTIVKSGKKKKHLHLEAEMVRILEGIRNRYEIRLVGLENVHAMPFKLHGRTQGVSSMFNMGTGFGLWLGIIAALKLPLERVEPRVWKKSIGIPTGSEKEGSRVRALQLFPKAPLERKKHHGRADAILLALYLHRKMNGKV